MRSSRAAHRGRIGAAHGTVDRSGIGAVHRTVDHRRMRAARGAVLVLLIMVIGSLVLWIGTPLLWLWVGSQVQGATGSLGAAFGAALVGAIATVATIAAVLTRLSDTYRANRSSRGLSDTGHEVLERVLVSSAGVSILVFAVWFLFFAGATPLPLGIQP